jgi:hypothetical protein
MGPPPRSFAAGEKPWRGYRRPGLRCSIVPKSALCWGTCCTEGKDVANTSALAKRFAELASQLESVEATKRSEPSPNFPRDSPEYRIDNDLFLNWKVKARHLISMACGTDSEHYRQFVQSGKPAIYRTNFAALKQLKAIFLAAKEDFEGGYLNSVRNLVQAEVFENELDQARELLSGGYSSAAAIPTSPTDGVGDAKLLKSLECSIKGRHLYGALEVKD